MSRHVPPPNLPSKAVDARRSEGQPHGCRNKVRYQGRKQALGGIAWLRKNDPDDPDQELLVAYKCPHGCHGWHVGHDQTLRRVS